MSRDDKTLVEICFEIAGCDIHRISDTEFQHVKWRAQHLFNVELGMLNEVRHLTETPPFVRPCACPRIYQTEIETEIKTGPDRLRRSG
jgi:hypothetical protein